VWVQAGQDDSARSVWRTTDLGVQAWSKLVDLGSI
jgi:hypothetical protein